MHCVVRNPINVLFSAVRVVLCIQVIGRVGAVGGECHREFVRGREQEVGEGVRIAGSGSNFADPVGGRVVIGINGIS